MRCVVLRKADYATRVYGLPVVVDFPSLRVGSLYRPIMALVKPKMKKGCTHG
jgi:hypothetical protein